MTEEGTPPAVVITLGRTPRKLLWSLIEAHAPIGAPGDDPAARRLYPAASSDESVAEAFAAMTHEELRTLHASDEAVLEDVLRRSDGDGLVMSTSEAEACVRAVGSVRIALAARVGMFEDNGSRVGLRQRAAVDFLAYVQDQMVQALMARLPDEGGASGWEVG